MNTLTGHHYNIMTISPKKSTISFVELITQDWGTFLGGLELFCLQHLSESKRNACAVYNMINMREADIGVVRAS